MPIIPKLKKEQPAEQVIEDYAELPAEISTAKHTIVSIEKIERFSDTDKILQKVRKGQIVFAMIRDMKNNNLDELKHAISKIRSSCAAMNGNVVGVGEDLIIITPPSAIVQK